MVKDIRSLNAGVSGNAPDHSIEVLLQILIFFHHMD